jgi:hypothetical protein
MDAEIPEIKGEAEHEKSFPQVSGRCGQWGGAGTAEGKPVAIVATQTAKTPTPRIHKLSP